MEREKGAGRIGCLLFILLCVVAGYVGVKVIPPYYNAREFEAAIEQESIKAGARGYSDEIIIKDIMSLAKAYEIQLTEDNVRVQRFGNRIGIAVEYEVPVVFELINYTYKLHFKVQTKSLAL